MDVSKKPNYIGRMDDEQGTGSHDYFSIILTVWRKTHIL